MAQATKSKATKSKATKSTKSSKAKSSKANNSKAKSSKRSTTSKGATKRSPSAAKKAPSAAKKAPSAAKGASEAAAARQAAVAGTKAAGRAVATATERAKTPLIVGGAAVAGVVGGLVVKRLNNGSRSSGMRLRDIPLPIRDGKLDLDAVASAAQSVGSFGQQLGDVANALKRVQKD